MLLVVCTVGKYFDTSSLSLAVFMINCHEKYHPKAVKIQVNKCKERAPV